MEFDQNNCYSLVLFLILNEVSANIFETHLHAIGDIGQLSTTEIPTAEQSRETERI